MKELDSYLCPECGADVPVGSAGCQSCGPRKIAQRMRNRKERSARSKKSWQQDQLYDGLDLPNEDFDYEDFVEKEFGGKPHRKVGIAWYWWLTALALVLLFAVFSFKMG